MIAKFVPGFATVAPPMAGAFKLALGPFLAYSAVGALLWSGAAVMVGMIFHSQVDVVLRWIDDMGPLALFAIGIGVGFYILVKWLERWFFMRMMRMVRVSVDELHELMQQAVVPVVLDARSVAARKLDPRRIPGALMIDTAAPVLHPGIGPDRDVVIYCT